MAYANNNIYGNAALVGMIAGCMSGKQGSATATDYAALKNGAAVFATAIDAAIANDVLVTTGAGVTQLAITTNTIAANEQWRAGALQAICQGYWSGRWSQSTTAGDYASAVAACVAAWTETLVGLVTP